MKQHRLQLCKDHYLDWFVQQTQVYIQKLSMFSRADKVLVAVSGGKDSLSLWDVLWRVDYQADGMDFHLGIDSEDQYSDASQAYCQRFAEERGFTLHGVNIRERYGKTVPEFARLKKWG